MSIESHLEYLSVSGSSIHSAQWPLLADLTTAQIFHHLDVQPCHHPVYIHCCMLAGVVCE